MNIYRYFFYKFYIISEGFASFGTSSLVNACINTIALIFFNILTILYWVETLFKKEIVYILPGFILLFLIVIGVYYDEIYKKKYLDYDKQYSNQTKARKLLGTLFFVIWILLSVGLFYHFYNMHLLIHGSG
jgi:hypothetical protein